MGDIIKRVIDIIVSGSVLCLLSILFLIVGALVWFSSPGGVLYVSERVGRKGRLFKIYKFRTMVVGADCTGSLNVPLNDNRVTTLGRFLRASKLDEFPQFYNVLIGDMSLVGPRPDLKRFIDTYSQEEKNIILSVQPGLSDWASLVNFEQYRQLEFAYAPDEYMERVTYPLKRTLQKYYCLNRSLFGDFCIVFRTVARIFHFRIPFPHAIKNIIEEHESSIEKIDKPS